MRVLIACVTRGLPIRPFLACAAIRMFLYIFSPRQIQLFMPPTIDTYKAFIRESRARARKQGDVALLEQLREDIEILPDGASHLLWIGDRSRATRFVYFFHGGGYMVPALPGHMEWCLQAYVRSSNNNNNNKGHKVAVALLQYTLTPSGRFPTQMCQAIAGLRHLVEVHGIRPGQIVVGGDSAGGNMTLQLLSHMLHPYPGAAAFPGAGGALALAEPLAGAFLVSPLVSGDSSGRSFSDGWACDMLSLGVFDDPNRAMFHEPPPRNQTAVEWLRDYLFPKWNLVESKAFRDGRGWALMADVGEKWLDGMDRIVAHVYVTCGRHELLRDQGIDIATRIEQRNSAVRVKLEVADKEAHDFILLEGERGSVGDATLRMRAWFSQVWA